MENKEPILVVKDLKQHFKINRNFTVKAVDGISFDIMPGETYGLVGESGSGKSTTGRSIIRLYKPTSGSIVFNGKEIGGKLDKETSKELHTKMQMIFQDPMACLNPRKKVIDIIGQGLDIHKSYQEYIDCKKNIFLHQSSDGILVLNADNEITSKMKSEANGKVIMFSSKQKLDNGVIYDNKTIKFCEDGLRRHVIDVKNVKLRGVHNYENICAAIAATASLVDIDTQIKAISEFSGVEHRLEYIRTINDVKWYNDSIGTSPSRTIAGLNSFDEKIVLIAGGYDKHLDYTPIAKPIVENVSALVLVGATTEKIYEAVTKELKSQNKEMPIVKCQTLEETIKIANQLAKPGEVVLFSPASASFDMFKNFAERGNIFKQLVNAI